MLEQLTLFFKDEEQHPHFKLLPDDGAPHLISKAEPGHHTEEFISAAWVQDLVRRPVDLEFCLSARLLLHYDRPEQLLHY